jgi:outer membrane protein TolC
MTMRNTQVAVLNSLMGLPVTNKLLVNNELTMKVLSVSQDSLLGYALDHRVEMALAKEKETVLTMQYKVVKSQNNPVLNAFASGGGKNGYMPTIDKIEPNISLGLGVRIPLFDGNRMKNNLTLAKSSITSSGYDTELARRNISNEVIENDANRLAAMQKINQYELQLEQATEAFSLATVSFKSGAVTNLDLLDAETSVSESRLMLLKAKIDYIVSIFRLKTALGDTLY